MDWDWNTAALILLPVLAFAWGWSGATGYVKRTSLNVALLKSPDSQLQVMVRELNQEILRRAETQTK